MKGEIRMYLIEAIIIFFIFIVGIAVGIIIEGKSLKKWFNKRLDDIYNQKDIKPLTVFSTIQIDRYNIDDIFFALIRNEDRGKLKLCYSDEHHSWIKTTIEYLPPMRWDLFKKGRLAVKVTYDNYKEFYEACERELGKKPSTPPMFWDGVTISICKKDGCFEIFTIEDQKKTGKKIVDWEDVR